MAWDTTTYLQRLGLASKDLPPTLASLRLLQHLHALAIPFENLDIHYGPEITLDIDRIFDKVMEGNRGGFCYELNGLFHELLLKLGFTVHRISARVYNVDTRQFGPEFDHLVNLVTLPEGRYLADVGFGGFAEYPLALQLGQPQADAYGTWQINPDPTGRLVLYAPLPEGITHKYSFTLQPREYTDFTGMCQYQQHNPHSHFRTRKLITRPLPHGRVTLTQDMLTIRDKGEKKETPLLNEGAFFTALKDHFGISLAGH